MNKYLGMGEARREGGYGMEAYPLELLVQVVDDSGEDLVLYTLQKADNADWMMRLWNSSDKDMKTMIILRLSMKQRDKGKPYEAGIVTFKQFQDTLIRHAVSHGRVLPVSDPDNDLGAEIMLDTEAYVTVQVADMLCEIAFGKA